MFSHPHARASSWHLRLRVARTPRPTAGSAAPCLLTGPRPAHDRARRPGHASGRILLRPLAQKERPRAPPPGLAPHDCPPQPGPRQWSHGPRASPSDTHKHRPKTRASASAHPSVRTTPSRPSPRPVPTPAANLGQMSPALGGLACPSYRPETSMPPNRLSLCPSSGLQPSPLAVNTLLNASLSTSPILL